MEHSLAPEYPPLPHLSGPATVPREIKQAHMALYLSGSGWTLLILCLVVLVAFVSGNLGKGEAADLLSSRRFFPFLMTVRVIAGSGVALCLFGMVLGFMSWKHRRGKAAALLGAANFVIVVIVVLAAFLTNRK